MQKTCYRKTPLDISLKLELTRMIKIGITPSGVIATRPDATQRKSTQVTGTTDIKLFAEWSHPTIAIRTYRTHHKSRGKHLARRKMKIAACLNSALGKLCKGGTQ